jgi:hypothetical protein
MMEATCTFGTPETLPTSTTYNNPRTELTSIINHYEGITALTVEFKRSQ